MEEEYKLIANETGLDLSVESCKHYDCVKDKFYCIKCLNEVKTNEESCSVCGNEFNQKYIVNGVEFKRTSQR